MVLILDLVWLRLFFSEEENTFSSLQYFYITTKFNFDYTIQLQMGILQNKIKYLTHPKA